ncbi:MAG: hypothetical protein PWQ55_1087 [Chloroflexota bacterium]|nr:hypothetical protein [Chloroflexota bacterium]
MDKIRELLEELRLVFGGRNSILDSILPPLLFVLANALFGLTPALWAAFGGSLAFVLLRLARRQPLKNALLGAGATALAAGLALLLKRAQAFFLPSLVNGALTVLVLLLSLVLKRPAVAFTSALTRRWPLQWYWHDRVRPAYSEVTAIWAVYSAIKLAFQYYFYRQGQTNALAVFNLASGWPALILLLVVSYLYGLKRLKQLGGPSVEEFKQDAPPPWQGQQRGF